MLDLTMKGINNVKIFNFLIGEVMRGQWLEKLRLSLEFHLFILELWY